MGEIGDMAIEAASDLRGKMIDDMAEELLREGKIEDICGDIVATPGMTLEEAREAVSGLAWQMALSSAPSPGEEPDWIDDECPEDDN